MPAKRYYHISKFALAIFFLLIGAYGGWFVFTRVLGKPYPEEGFRPVTNDDKPKKDTVYVKVVDPVFAAGNNNYTRDTQTRREPAYKTPEQNIDVEQRKNIGVTTAKSTEELIPSQTEPLLKKRVVSDISENAYNTALRAGDMENKTAFKKIFNSLNIWVAVAAAMLILIVAFFAKDDAVANATLKDIPPAILETLFAKMSREINLFRNPRKILRYRNAASYHYFFFKQKNLDTPENVEKMMWLLLAIHHSPELVDTRHISDEALAEPDWFLQKLAASPYANTTNISMPEDKDMVMLVLKLNADMG